MLAVCGRRSYASNTVFSDAVSVNDAAGGFSFRLITPTLTIRGAQCRATFKAGPSGALNLNHASVGKSAGSGTTTTTPTELLFGGVSGCSISAGGTATSDWTQIPDFTSVGDSLVIVHDAAATANYALDSASSASQYLKAATASYNSSSATGFSLQASTNDGVSLVEVRL